MEDLKRRLEFDNVAIQRQALNKLREEVRKSLSQENKLTASSAKSAACKLMEEKCGAMETVVAKATCSLMVELVKDGLAEFSSVLESFLNQVPNSKNLCGIVQGTSDLLLWQAVVMAGTKDGYTNPYTLRSPPHPFITILTNQPDSWLLLGNQVTRIFGLKDLRLQELALDILEPFLKFVFAEPLNSPQYQPMRMCLEREMLSLASQSQESCTKRTITGFLTSILPCLQVKDKVSLGRTALLVMGVTDVCLEHVTETENDLRKLMTFLLDLCWEFLAQSLDISMVTHYLTRAAEVAPNALVSDDNFISLAALLMRTDAEDAQKLLYPVMKALESSSEQDPSVIAVTSLVLPLLQFLSLPTSGSTTDSCKPVISLAAKILKSIEERTEKPPQKDTQVPPLSNSHLTSSSYLNNSYSLLARALEGDDRLPGPWLQNLTNTVPKMKSVPVQVTAITSALFILSPGKPWADQSLKALQTISKADVQQANYFLPLYIYQMNKDVSPEFKLSIMKAIPSIAQHKFCIPPVLKAIQMFGSSPRLKALSIQLLTDLWKIQDRSFPYLLKAITEPAPGVLTIEGVDEVKLAKVKAIRDVCMLRGEQHGSDVLSPLSDILESSTQEEDSPVVSLALEGLYYLCKAEVVDILSLWSALGDKLVHDTRSIVQERICQLFALLPELEVKTEEFEKLQHYAVASLWLFALGPHAAVSIAAWRALSVFNTSSFKLSHIPDQVKEDIVRKAEAMIARGDNPDLTVEDVVTDVPGVCFTRLMDIIPAQVLEGYSEFLSKQVGSEVRNLPRGVYHTSARRLGVETSQSKTLETLPAFLQQQYDKCRQPGLRPGLAAGLLFTYDPPMEVGRDGRPRVHYSITHSKSFYHMFTTLLHEVIFQPSDWMKVLHLPQAWFAFMDRLFSSAVEGRRAEIDLQLKKDHIGREEAESKQKKAWLWVRDKLTDMIKTAARESPNVQGNAILSLGGLALVSQKYWSDLDKESQGQLDQVKEFQSQAHWLTVVMDTLMSLMDVTFKPKGGILGICQQRSVEDRISASFLTQASAVLTLCQLVPVMINSDVNRIFGLLDRLTGWLPGQPKAPEAPVLHMAYGVGLGGLLGRLFEEHFMETCGSSERVQVWKSLDKLEEAGLTGKEESVGYMLGLGLAVSALCNDSQTEARAHVLSVIDKLQSLLESQSLEHQILIVDLALISSVAFNANILSADKVLSIIDRILDFQKKAAESSAVAVASGLMLHSFNKARISTLTDQQMALHQVWTHSLSLQESAPMVRIAALSGLMSLIGSQRNLTASADGPFLSLGDINVDEVLKVVKQVITTGDDLGVQNNAVWMLGQYYMSTSGVRETRTSVPSSLSYLPESSLLRATVDFLINAGKKGPEAVTSPQVECCLRSLGVGQSLPPVHWAGILTPLMRLNFSDEVKRLCLQVGISQSASSSTATLFVSSWLTPPLLRTLKEPCRCLLYDELPALVTTVSPATLTLLLEAMQSETGSPRLHGLYGLHRALKVPDPPNAVKGVLLNCLKNVYKAWRNEMDHKVLHLLAECVGSVADEVFDELTEPDFSGAGDHFLSCFVRCYLLAQGRQPLALLNRCIDSTLNCPESDTPELNSLFNHAFWHVRQSSAESNGDLHCRQWLLELLGHTRNLATGAVTLAENVKDKQKVIQSAVRLAASAITIWTSSSTALIYNINPDYLTNIYPCTPFIEGHDVTLSECPESPVDVLPSCVSGLEVEPWSQISLKVLDWLSLMQKMQPSFSPILSAAEIGLKHSTDFKRASTWTDILHRYKTGIMA
ncbi:focadhesin-like [Crassostrea virginica]